MTASITPFRAIDAESRQRMMLDLAGDVALIFLTTLIFTRQHWSLYAYFGIPMTLVGSMAFVGLVIALKWYCFGTLPTGWLRPAVFGGIYLAICAASYTMAIDISMFREHLDMMAKGFAIFVLTVALIDRFATIDRIIWCILCCAFVMGTVSIYQYATQTFNLVYWGFGWATHNQHIFGQYHGTRTAGPLRDPNFYAQILVVFVPLAVSRIWWSRNIVSIGVAAWVLFVCTVSFMLTYSRGGFVAAVAVLLLLITSATLRRPRAWRLCLSGGVLAAALLLMPPYYLQRIGTFRQFIPDRTELPTELHPSHTMVSATNVPLWATDIKCIDNTVGQHHIARVMTVQSHALNDSAELFASSQLLDRLPQEVLQEPGFKGRISENLVAWQMFLDHPWRGVGLGNYPVHYQRYATELKIDPRREARDAHNLYLEIAAETGIPGFTAFAVLLGYAFLQPFRARRRTVHYADDQRMQIEAFTIGLIGYLIAAMFLQGSRMEYFWILLAFAVAMGQNVAKPAIQTGGTQS